ncbi:MAG: DUF1003 domain-containing protein [Acidobacteria bacterium]|nr:DUF1003 domain-containing protein [Acidobacteriota bacterium]MBI3486644.1 DUF1003 domain-containing protein [Acidobacteriota bacterium]
MPPSQEPLQAPGNTTSTSDQRSSQSIDAVLDFYTREDQKITRSQRILERVSLVIGKPLYLGTILLLVLLWVATNLACHWMGKVPFDPAPFIWLQGLIGLGALVTATIVLSKQNRLSKLAEQRAHLDLKVTLLTEQKAAKLIDLLEELRRDLPNVENRTDPHAEALQKAMNPDLVLAALGEDIHPDQHLNQSSTRTGFGRRQTP